MKNILRLLTGYKRSLSNTINRTPNFFAPAYRTGRPLRLCALIFLCAFAPLRDLSAQKAIHELPAKTTIDTNYLLIQGNPTTGKLYKTRGAALNAFISGGGGTTTDTTSLSNRIDLKLNISDTAGLSNRIDAIGPHTDTTSLSNRIDAIPTISSFSKNAGRDSTILLLSSGTRYAVKDSIGASGGGGSQTLDQVLTTGNIANLLYTDANYKYTNWVVPTSTPLNSNFDLNIKKITPSEFGTNATVGLWSETIRENQSGQEGSPTARKNVSWSWGYNTDQGIANEGYIKFSIESNYRPGGGAEWFEWHAPEVMTRDGSINRWYSVTGSKASPSATHTFRGNTLQFLDITNPSDELFGFDGSLWKIKGDYVRLNPRIAGNSSKWYQFNTVDINEIYYPGSGGNININSGGATTFNDAPIYKFSGEVYSDKMFYVNTTASRYVFNANNNAGIGLFSIYSNATNTGSSIQATNASVIFTAANADVANLFNCVDNTQSYSYFRVLNTGQVGISTPAPVASAILEITSTTKGFLPPRMTKTQRDAISSPATGLVVYQTDNTPGLRCYNGTNWMRYTETTD